MIIVMPNAYTAYQGSMYSSSPTTGDWETFVARDLVSYVDSHYRTIPEAASRGLAGHSMGGYGTVRIGMKNPDVFSSLYILSPCCMSANIDPKPSPKAEAIHSAADLAHADFGTKAQLASAAAWSPNPKNPPLFLDLPYKGDELQPAVVAKWAANAPLAMIDQYIANLRKMHAIAMDAGDKDEPIASTVRTLGPNPDLLRHRACDSKSIPAIMSAASPIGWRPRRFHSFRRICRSVTEPISR